MLLLHNHNKSLPLHTRLVALLLFGLLKVRGTHLQVLVVLRVRNLDCAIELIHSHPSAQSVSLYTRDGGVARRFTQTVQAGMVGINVALPLPRAWIGAGGWKGSLFGDLQAYGPEAVRFYTRRKAVMQVW